MTAENRLSRLAWTDYKKRLDAGTIVLLPVGAQEAHAGHLPLATDTIIAQGVCEAIANDIDAVIAPAIPFGFKSQIRSGGGHHWPGNIGLDGNLLVELLRRVLKDLREKGAQRIAIINAHLENSWFIAEACNLAAEDASEDARFKIFSADWWSMLSGDDMTSVFDPPPGDPSYEHAALIETALMLHLAPDTVNLDAAPEHDFVEFQPYDVYPRDGSEFTESGALAPIKNANAIQGKELLGIAATKLAGAIANELDASWL